jgi:nitroreductase
MKGAGSMEDNIEYLVKSRHSVRNFYDKPIDEHARQELQKMIDECNDKADLSIQLVLNEKDAFGKSRYGSIKNCQNYIAMIGPRSKDLDKLCGYYGEKLVLKAQELGLNTCWVELTYNKSKVPCIIDSNEKLVIVIALGYGKTNGDTRKSKSFEDVSKTIKNVPDWYRRGVDFALYAPTAMNQQKFKFELVDENEVSLKVAGLGICTDIDLGIVKYHFELGAGVDNFNWV